MAFAWSSLYIIALSMIVQRGYADCVMFGLCNQKQYCISNRTAEPVSDLFLTNVCGINAPTRCCDQDQLKTLGDKLLLLEFLVKHTTDDHVCYDGLRQIFCDITCSPRQSEIIKVTGHNATDGAVTSIDFWVSRNRTQVIFDACYAIDNFILGKPVDVICNQQNCSMETFFSTLGVSEDLGGRSPYAINFIFINDATNSSSTTLKSPPPSAMVDAGSVVQDHSSIAVKEDEKASAVAEPVGMPEDLIFPRRLFKHPLWLAMLLTFLGLTLLFLLGLAIRWCVLHQREESASTSACAHSPPIGCYSKIGATIQFGSAWLFARQGALVAQFPHLTLLITAILLAIACCGFLCFRVTTDPVELWSDPNSRARLEKAYFDEHFGPFYRTEQIIIQPVNATPYLRDGQAFGSIFDKRFLKLVLDLQTQVTQVRAFSTSLGREIALSDICHKPLEPVSSHCGVFSPLEYFQSNATLLGAVSKNKKKEEDYFDHLKFCTKLMSADSGPLGSCRGRSGVPMFGNVVFGGVKDDDFMQSSAVVITIMVKNSIDRDSPTVLMAKAWESEVIHTILSWRAAHPEVVVSFAVERSVEDEIIRQSHSDISTIVISYAVMVVYVSLCLGNYRGFRTCLVDLKISLSIGGVLIVLASVFSSIGFWSFLGVPATLIIIEVIPFLVLAIGVDNIFIMVQDFLMHDQEEGEEDDEDEDGVFGSQESLTNDAPERGGTVGPTSGCVGGGVSRCVGGKAKRNNCKGQSGKRLAGCTTVESRIAKTMGRVGPSMFLSSLAESVAFFCGAMTDMPAVRVFALYAGVAIVINFVLQIFAFTALLTLDAKRWEANRLDLCCCVELVMPSRSLTNEDDSIPEAESLANRRKSNRKNDRPFLYRFVAHVLAPFILSKWIRALLFIIFLGWICFCIAIIPGGIQIGLDQRLSMSLDSYVLEYFEAVSSLLAVGPPVYFVVTEGHNFESLDGQNQICSRPGCDSDSLVRTMKESIASKNYRISGPLMAWMDDYTLWSRYPNCCGVKGTTGNFTFCDATREQTCNPCPLVEDRLLEDSFNQFLPHFLSRVPSSECPYGGKAQYGSAVFLTQPYSNATTNASGQHSRVLTSLFSAHHTVLRNTDDFIEAIRKAREISDVFAPRWVEKAAKSPPVFSMRHGPKPNTVFPYSIFYVFYEQYLNIVYETMVQMSMGLSSVSIITWVLLGLDFVATLNVVVGVASISISVAAMMVLWDISLNAISLVNLVVCIGISVEFCAHIVRSFTISTKATRVERALDALSEMGSSVLRGITLTKFGGIVVLGFAKSRLFQVFYFRMYLCMVLFGAVVGVIFLPVQLSYFGPQLNRAMLYKQKRPVSGSIRRSTLRGQRNA